MKNSNNRVTENIIALTLVKGMDYILAFITFPYLVRVLQVETYGLIVFSQSIVNYFTLFTDYGFNLSGPKAIAQHDDKEEYGIVFANIFGAKLFLLLFWTVVFVIMLCVMTFWGKTDFKLYMIVFLSVIVFITKSMRSAIFPMMSGKAFRSNSTWKNSAVHSSLADR